MRSNLRSGDIGFSWYYGENIHKSCIDYIITNKQTRPTKPPSLFKKKYQYFIEIFEAVNSSKCNKEVNAMSTPEFLQQHIWDNEIYTF